jgi:hypothetical protein
VYFAWIFFMVEWIMMRAVDDGAPVMTATDICWGILHYMFCASSYMLF